MSNLQSCYMSHAIKVLYFYLPHSFTVYINFCFMLRTEDWEVSIYIICISKVKPNRGYVWQKWFYSKFNNLSSPFQRLVRYSFLVSNQKFISTFSEPCIQVIFFFTDAKRSIKQFTVDVQTWRIWLPHSLDSSDLNRNEYLLFADIKRFSMKRELARLKKWMMKWINDRPA